MKISVLMLLLSAVCVFAQRTSVTFAWDPSPATNIVNYTIYFGKQSGNYKAFSVFGNVTNGTIELPDMAMYYFACTAKDANGNESGYSNEVSYSGAPPPAAIIIVETKTAANTNWTSIAQFPVTADSTNAIFRMRIQLANNTNNIVSAEVTERRALRVIPDLRPPPLPK